MIVVSGDIHGSTARTIKLLSMQSKKPLNQLANSAVAAIIIAYFRRDS